MSAEPFHAVRVASSANFPPDAPAPTAAIDFGDPQAEYAALTSSAALVDLPRRTRVDLTGSDRADFLHNLCTNDVRRLTPGTGCEALLLNASGKILAFINVFCHEDRLVLDSAPDQADKIVQHLDRYLIREDVTLIDRSHDTIQLLLGGPELSARLSDAGIVNAAKITQSDPLYSFATVDIASTNVTLRRVDFTGPADLLLDVAREHAPAVWTAFVDLGLTPCGSRAFEVARVEHGTPQFAIDISDANLPQELDRDDRAISFVKGCYIGQETVARIDALGHVNQVLRGVRFDAETTAQAGKEISVDGKTAARLTSLIESPRAGSPFALAYVRREFAQPGTKLATDQGPATVSALPLA